MLARLIVRLIFGALGLWLAEVLLAPGIHIKDTATLIVAALLLGIVNAVVRPIVVILTLPLTIVTLGLFLLVVNAAMIGLVSMLLPHSFTVSGLVPGIFAAIITGAVSWVGQMVVREDRA
jgi:putative membrane protein